MVSYLLRSHPEEEAALGAARAQLDSLEALARRRLGGSAQPGAEEAVPLEARASPRAGWAGNLNPGRLGIAPLNLRPR